MGKIIIIKMKSPLILSLLVAPSMCIRLSDSNTFLALPDDSVYLWIEKDVIKTDKKDEKKVDDKKDDKKKDEKKDDKKDDKKVLTKVEVKMPPRKIKSVFPYDHNPKDTYEGPFKAWNSD